MAETRQLRRASAKKRFLEAFAVYGIIGKACEVAQVARANVYVWQEHDEQFALAFNVANERATEVLEAEARRRAVEGTRQEKPVFYLGQQIGTVVETEYSDGLLMFLLKARAPHKYKERLALDVPMILKTLKGVDVDAL